VLRLTWVRDRLAHVLEHELWGNVVSDAYLAALAIEHGLDVCSDDSDFAVQRDPLDQPGGARMITALSPGF
jgi:predicted nucleic acid-binding protein